MVINVRNNSNTAWNKNAKMPELSGPFAAAITTKKLHFTSIDAVTAAKLKCPIVGIIFSSGTTMGEHILSMP